MKDYGLRISGHRQIKEWEDIMKTNPATYGLTDAQVIKDFPLQYDQNVAVSNPNDLVTKQYVDVVAQSAAVIGTPTDGSYTDGLLDLSPSTKVSDATDEINEILTDLAPSDALTLNAQSLAINASSTTQYSGYLSDSPTASYKASQGAGTSVSYIVKTVPFVLITPNTTTSINKGDTGVLKLFINDVLVDSFDLGAKFDEAKRNSYQTYTELGGGNASTYNSANGLITVNDVRKYNNFRKWQKCITKVNISSAVLREGYNKIVLAHDNIPTPQVSNAWDLFYDKDAGANPIVTINTLTVNAPTSSKYLSGVRFLSTGDTIQLTAVANNIFNNVYVQTPVNYSGFTGISGGSIAPSDSSVSGVSTPPKVSEIMNITNKVLTLNTANVCSTDAKLTLNAQDPYGTYSSIQSPSKNILVSTFADGATGQATDKVEYFTNEHYRLPLNFNFDDKSASVKGVWNSQTLLANGNAQYYMSSNVPALMYPTGNFTTGYNPSQTANYSTFTGSQKFTRCFISSAGQTSVSIQLDGVAAGIGTVGTGDVNVEIKLPTQTAWLDAAKAYNSSAGVGVDGNGCLNGSISYASGNATLNLTFGGKTTTDANNRMYVRITLNNGNRIIKKITCTNW